MTGLWNQMWLFLLADQMKRFGSEWIALAFLCIYSALLIAPSLTAGEAALNGKISTSCAQLRRLQSTRKYILLLIEKSKVEGKSLNTIEKTKGQTTNKQKERKQEHKSKRREDVESDNQNEDNRSKFEIVKETYSNVSNKGSNKIDDKEVDKYAYILRSLNNPTNWKATDTHLRVYTVPRYAENHNPMLPLTLQQRLDRMSPREFLSYVLNDLTLEERESLMVDERQRRRSFQAGWPHSGDLSGNSMARAGFYSVDNYDRVQCVFCQGCLHQWELDDNPMVEHRRSFNFCRFVKGLQCGNKEYRSNKLSNDDLRNITRFQRAANGEETDSGLLGISTNRAATVQYAPNSTRLRTFSRWPANAPIAAQRMCDAGFYYTGFDDQVCCFYCDGGIKSWAAADDPWEEHARWFPDCAYLIQKKGLTYIDQVHSRTPASKKCVRKTINQQIGEVKMMESKTTQEDMKKICLKLGHSSEVIEKAIKINGKPFDNVKTLIEAVYCLEEGGDEAADGPKPIYNSLDGNSVRGNMLIECPEEELQRRRVQDVEVRPAVANDSERLHKYEQGCRRCELRIDTFVPATHVGLPCGHLILCESCNREETNKTSSDSTYSVECPFRRCGASLTGSIRIYFA